MAIVDPREITHHQEIRARNYERVEKLFQRCLIRVLSIELWKTYLLYVKETKASLPTYKEKMAQAYDFALDKMGLDIQSFSLWNDYIKFLKGVDAPGNFAENQKIAAIRKVWLLLVCGLYFSYYLCVASATAWLLRCTSER